MGDAIAHRGPDAHGVWTDAAHGIALSHRRLSIIDLSEAGAQPMTSASGRFVLVFNGETYNFGPIRDELSAAGVAFRGTSDTEVLLAAFERWGIARSIPRFAGMFACAVWDRDERTLTLIRDRLGEKPLYYGRVGTAWAFGSELKSLQGLPAWRGDVSPAAAAQLLRHGYVQAPLTIYDGIAKVLPGTYVVLRAGREPVATTYWDPVDVARRGIANPLTGTPDEIASELEALLLPIVRDEMIADVPFGAFLSGGIDSSLVVALMQAVSTRPVRTFTIAVDDEASNEAPFAAAVAAHLGTEHTEIPVTGTDVLDIIPDLASIYDEPLADPSQLPTLLLSRLTRQHVTVALSGDGGDELFGGYQHHRSVGGTAAIGDRTPRFVRALLGPALLRFPEPSPNAITRLIAGRGHRPANTINKLGAFLLAHDEQQRHSAQHAMTVRPARFLDRRYRDGAGVGALRGAWLHETSPFAARMLFDSISYLPDDILMKVDRAAMAYSLETRAPLLDHRVFEFAWRVPYERKVRDGIGKMPLRDVLYRYVPRALIDRPKRGFVVPLGAWLRGPLREWADELLAPRALAHDGVLAAEPVARLWSQHRRGTADHSYLLWSILALSAFLRREKTGGAPCGAPVRRTSAA